MVNIDETLVFLDMPTNSIIDFKSSKSASNLILKCDEKSWGEKKENYESVAQRNIGQMTRDKV
jgi:hypothetical protein